MILQWERIHNDPCLLCFKYVNHAFIYALNTIYCFLYALNNIYCFPYALNIIYFFHYALSTFIAFTMWIICNFLSAIYIYYAMIIIPFTPRDLGMKILIGLGQLCKTFNGINNYVIP